MFSDIPVPQYSVREVHHNTHNNLPDHYDEEESQNWAVAHKLVNVHAHILVDRYAYPLRSSRTAQKRAASYLHVSGLPNFWIMRRP